MTRSTLRQALADAVLAHHLHQQAPRGIRRLALKRAAERTLGELAKQLAEADEQPAGSVWYRALRVVFLWQNKHSIKKAMQLLLAAYEQTFREAT